MKFGPLVWKILTAIATVAVVPILDASFLKASAADVPPPEHDIDARISRIRMEIEQRDSSSNTPDSVDNDLGENSQSQVRSLMISQWNNWNNYWSNWQNYRSTY